MKYILSFLLCLMFFSSKAQMIYSQIEIMDEFDDLIKVKNTKTLFEVTDDSIIVKTKGKGSRCFYIDRVEYQGGPSNIVNLIKNVYGYDAVYYCHEIVVDSLGALVIHRPIIHRTICSKYTQEYIKDLWWIYDNDLLTSRSIYR